MDLRQRLINLANQRTQLLNSWQEAIDAGNQSEAASLSEQVTNINAEIESCQNLLREQERNIDLAQPSEAEARDMAEERMEALTHGREVTLGIDEIRRSLRNADGDGTVIGGTIAQPTGAGSVINDNLGLCSLLDLVRVENMEGLSGWAEPYAISDMATADGVPSSVAGQARTKHDPSFGVVEIKPYEVTTTSLIDRNIRRLSPAAYNAKIQAMAIRALKNEIAKLILLGDSEVSHVMYGMRNGVNKAGTSMVKTVTGTVTNSKGVVDTGFIDNMYFEYGDGLTCGGNGMLFLNKKDLKALGKLRGTNEKAKLFGVVPMPGDANRGTITDGGMIVPYLINSNLTELDGKSQEASTGADILTAIYGDPMNYLLGLFGGYTIRIDESVKAIERMDAILGDALVGGNVVAKDGFVITKLPKAST